MIIGNCPVCGAEMRVGTDMTNGDRIRSMTDEELADELLEWFACFMAVEWSREQIIEYLKQEATNA